MIRLIEKIEKNPAYAKVLGIDSIPAKLRTGDLEISDHSGCCRS